MAQDQNGCRFLQKKFDEGGPAAISMVFQVGGGACLVVWVVVWAGGGEPRAGEHRGAQGGAPHSAAQRLPVALLRSSRSRLPRPAPAPQEILEALVALMSDPFGNYLIQKLLDRCSEEQRLQVRRAGRAGRGRWVHHCACCRPASSVRPTQQPCLPVAAPALTLLHATLALPGTNCVLPWMPTLRHPPACPPAPRHPRPRPPQVLRTVSGNGELVNVALNTHGTRAVQKLIETLTSREQVQLVIDALKPGVVSLIRDLNGNHVVQRCLQVGAGAGAGGGAAGGPCVCRPV